VAWPTCSKTMSGASRRISLTRFAKPRDSWRLAALAHHAGELVAVDVVHRAELLDQLALLRRRHDPDRVGARGLAELRREDAEPAGGAPDEHVMARLEPAAVDEHAVGGEVGEPVGRGLDPREVGGLGQELLGLDLGELGERPPGGLVAPDLLARGRQRVQAVDLHVLIGRLVAVDDHLVTRLPLGDARADRPDDTRRVGAADVVAPLGMIAVAEDRHWLAERRPDVVEVHACGHDAHDHLERSGLGELDLLELESVLGLALTLGANHPRRHRSRQLAGRHVELRDLGYVYSHASPLGIGQGRKPRAS
jgi:hypothetical protein